MRCLVDSERGELRKERVRRVRSLWETDAGVEGEGSGYPMTLLRMMTCWRSRKKQVE